MTAHQLTSIVITVSAAEAAGRRDEALEFATRTGRETLTALYELFSAMPPDTLPAPGSSGLVGLVDGFQHLGQSVIAEVPVEEPPPAVTEAVFSIAREALTNTLRYAPGGTVRLAGRAAGWSWLLAWGVQHAFFSPGVPEPVRESMAAVAIRLGQAVQAVSSEALNEGVWIAVPLMLAWLAGNLARHRRQGRQVRERVGVEAALAGAAAQAQEERTRLSAGLRDEVLRHTNEVLAAAEREDLGAVVGSARRALTAVRALLDGLRPRPGSGPEAVPVLPAAATRE
ncbi:hypothetical protein [Paractinoplanes rishiriensis]|uniref:histidine kinase n=1 Tax=Paractinoplanes rishiriensis TaxID=1050105 RepID=A0A919MW87_9ACTN|nr:hypothetical protein [Actinoplanes rishiriensis]GIE97209.1 hypothetical protein Ari01nite_46740 [Actinoplanes rishiriensis]